MKSLPIINGFREVNAAICHSPHLKYHRLIIDKPKTDNARTEPICDLRTI